MIERCRSCGRELVTEDDHADGDVETPFCTTCADREGNLYRRERVEDRLVAELQEEEDVDEHAARQHVRRKLDEMPAWK
ncbi:MAG: zinc ribbon domain-containing protein [Candidatus Nanohaloarchaea archaeon]|nr:zinc ribbon domain-containing protein [Candidatus Nanohaloarchaea archaeon]